MSPSAALIAVGIAAAVLSHQAAAALSRLAQAAIDAVGRWRSEPPRVNGAPVARVVIVQVKFRP